MVPPSQPTEIAREAIKRLASGKLPPTPENFRRAYLEVSGQESSQGGWAEAIRLLLKQWETYQTGLTQPKKREMLERVLINFGNDPEQLVEKLHGLARSWAATEQSGPPVDDGGAALAIPAAGVGVGEKPAVPVLVAGAAQVAALHEPVPRAATPAAEEAWGRLLADSLEGLCGECDGRWPDLGQRGRRLARRLSGSAALPEADAVSELAGLWREILLRSENDHVYVDGLKRLLALLLENVAHLVAEEDWFSGQLATLRAAVSGDLNSHALYQVESSLKEVLERQRNLKGSLDDAKRKLKQLISTFINRVGEIADSTGNYHTRIQTYSERIAKAEDIRELADVIDGLSSDVVGIRGEMQRTHEDLLEARNHVEQAESRIQSLEKELEEVSALVREDQLTGALNRRGLDEAYAREASRAERAGTSLSLALLDLDHFKRLNDALGHQAGDQALIHLSRVVRRLLRPLDCLSRYGGEEFLILLPNTGQEEAVKVLQRLQRELTKEYFLHDNQRVLITFSAGVAERQPGEDRDTLIARADAAMYRAKANGRNRVEAA